MTSTETLNRRRLAQRIRQHTRLTQQQVEEVVDLLVSVVSQHLAEGGRVEIENFLTLTVEPRTGRRHFDEPAVRYRVLRCRAGKHLRQQLQQISKK